MFFKFLDKVTRDVFASTKFEEGKGKIHWINLDIGDKRIWEQWNW